MRCYRAYLGPPGRGEQALERLDLGFEAAPLLVPWAGGSEPGGTNVRLEAVSGVQTSENGREDGCRRQCGQEETSPGGPPHIWGHKEGKKHLWKSR